MAPPISIQLHTLREFMGNGGHVEVVERLGRIGFMGVEGGVPAGVEPLEWRKLVEDNGMVICSSVGPVLNPENAAQTIDYFQALGVRYVMSGYYPVDRYADREAIARVADELNVGYELAKGSGITFLLHNHDWEFQRIDGELKMDLLIERCPAVRLILDVYWAANHGAEDPVEMVRHLAHRAPMFHLKDGMMQQGEPMLACGSGKQDFPAILAAADPDVLAWTSVELDHCATDMWEAVEQSYRYLVGEGLCAGRVDVAAV